MTTPKTIIRQGDVLLTPVAKLPADCTEVPLDKGRIVLAYGEVTGHAHAIADHGQAVKPRQVPTQVEYTPAVLRRVTD